ncbi:phosphohydrolase [Galliscardovia ingluviei]|uniref:Phosphohydrolase n=2 Tax=Galliscardovia ingluviei TaxID=1769422 RepID=A0A8J3AKZ5_9BIFI|nr:phosphohydrolase [Galliscardovia ingluviei]
MGVVMHQDQYYSDYTDRAEYVEQQEYKIQQECPDLSTDAHDSVDMSVPPRVLTSPVTYQGAVFNVEDRFIKLTAVDGSALTIRRQVMVHNPCVVMLVHDCTHDTYLVEREYRVGPHAYVFGLPAGIMEDGELPHRAALRELREETGIVADTSMPLGDSIYIDDVVQTYSSEGMSNEIANIMVIHLQHWSTTTRKPDTDEHVHSGWVSWQQLNDIGIVSSNATIAILHEKLHRLTDAAHYRVNAYD